MIARGGARGAGGREMSVGAGKSFPLGASVGTGGVDFSLLSSKEVAGVPTDQAPVKGSCPPGW
jgi:hypothetical protein